MSWSESYFHLRGLVGRTFPGTSKNAWENFSEQGISKRILGYENNGLDLKCVGISD